MHKTKKPFVDFRAIRAQVTMEQVLDHYGVLDTFKRNGNRLSGPCPIHGGSNPTQFRVDTDKNLWNCFSECKNGGNVLDVEHLREGLDLHVRETAIQLVLQTTGQDQSRAIADAVRAEGFEVRSETH